MNNQAEAGCARRCYGAEKCAVGWPDGSCGAKEQGTAWPPPEDLPIIVENPDSSSEGVAIAR